MKKWFSFNQETQKVEVIEANESVFQNAPENLLFWSRGLDEWVKAPTALGHFLSAGTTITTETTPVPTENSKPTFPLKTESEPTKSLKDKAAVKKKLNKKIRR